MIRRFSLLNGLAIVGAVFYHASGWGFTAMFWWTDQYAPVTVPNFAQMGSAGYYALRVVEQLIIFAVPAFLFVSGFFIAFATGRSRPNVEWKLVVARIRSLLVPYLLWSALMFLWLIMQGQRFGPLTMLQMLVTGRTAAPYYFVPLIIQLFLLSPLLVPLARQHWRLLLVVTVVIQLSVRTLIYLSTIGALPSALRPLMPVTASWLFPGHLFWFAWGIITGFNLEGLKRLLARIKWYLLAIVIILFPLGMLEWELILRASPEAWIASRETVLDSFYAAAVILTFLAFHDIPVPYSAQLGELGTKSFGIYLAHAPVLEVTARVVYNLAPFFLAYQFLFQPLLVLIGIGIPLLLMRLVSMEKSPVRIYYQYIFG
ncbi:MAG TPA: acyltransferase family protein [Candidatus Binatia bacterium]|nr:acyltransferase family protein [Candidatus Binatia bacterium]